MSTQREEKPRFALQYKRLGSAGGWRTSRVMNDEQSALRYAEERREAHKGWLYRVQNLVTGETCD